MLKPNAPTLPSAACAYLDLIAFRAADEPTDACALVEKFVEQLLSAEPYAYLRTQVTKDRSKL